MNETDFEAMIDSGGTDEYVAFNDRGDEDREIRAVIVPPHTDHPPCSMPTCRSSHNGSAYASHVFLVEARPLNGTEGLLADPVHLLICGGCHRMLDIAATEAFRAYHNDRDDEGKNEGRGVE